MYVYVHSHEQIGNSHCINEWLCCGFHQLRMYPICYLEFWELSIWIVLSVCFPCGYYIPILEWRSARQAVATSSYLVGADCGVEGNSFGDHNGRRNTIQPARGNMCACGRITIPSWMWRQRDITIFLSQHNIHNTHSLTSHEITKRKHAISQRMNFILKRNKLLLFPYIHMELYIVFGSKYTQDSASARGVRVEVDRHAQHRQAQRSTEYLE